MVDVRVRLRSSVGILDEALDLTADLCTALFLQQWTRRRSPDHHAYDLFFQNHAQTKVYGPSQAMIDNWKLRVSQLELTKTTHKYVIYQLLATACGRVEEFPAGPICQSQATHIRPAREAATPDIDHSSPPLQHRRS